MPVDAVLVRPARPDELDAVGELTVTVYRGEGLSYPQYEPSLRDAASRAATATVLVAVAGERLLGTGTVATQLGPWAEQAGPGEAVVRMLAVDPAARGTGVGEAVLRACVERARQDGCELVRLSSHDGSPAHRLYERAGFVRDPAHDWVPHEGVLLRAFALPLVTVCRRCGHRLLSEAHGGCRGAARFQAGSRPPVRGGAARR